MRIRFCEGAGLEGCILKPAAAAAVWLRALLPHRSQLDYVDLGRFQKLVVVGNVDQCSAAADHSWKNNQIFYGFRWW